MRKILYLFFLITSSLVIAQGQYENQVVQSIDIEVMDHNLKGVQESSLVEQRMQTRVGQLFSQHAFDQDLKVLAKEYDWVEPRIEWIDQGVSIALKVWPKPIIRSIEFRGNRKISTRELLSELEMSESSVFDRTGFNQAFHKLKTYYVKQGFFEAELSYQIETNDPGCVDIIICVQEGRSGRIRKICFEGFKKRETQEICDLLVTKKWNLFTSVFAEGGHYNEDMIRYDEYQVTNYLQSKGFADAKVTIEAVESPKPLWIDVCIRADRGIPYTFSQVSFEGNEIFSDETIEQLLVTKTGGCFSPDAIRQSIKNLQDAYGIKGHIEAIIDQDLILDSHEPKYRLHFMIEEGEEFRVGLVKISGNTMTKDRVILHETLLCPGEVFNAIKLKITEERLRNIGYFKTVNVYAVRTAYASVLGDLYRDIHIEVEEDSTGSLGAFMGFSTGDDVFGGFNITEKNFNASNLNYKKLRHYGPYLLKGGGEYAHLTATLGQKTRSYVLSWTKPYFRDTQWAVGFDAERNWNGTISDDFDITSHGISLHAKKFLNAFVTLGVHYRIKDSSVDVKDSKAEQSKELADAAKNTGIVSGLGFSLIYNSTNHPIKPFAGFKSKFDSELVGYGGKYHFFSVSYLNSMYRRLGDSMTLKLRADAKFIQPLDGRTETAKDAVATLPMDERLYLGGDFTVRGYRPYALGPKYLREKTSKAKVSTATVSTVKASTATASTAKTSTEQGSTEEGSKEEGSKKEEKSDDPTGGVSMIVLSCELVYPMIHPVADAFVFFDGGYLSEKTWHVNTGSLRTSVGFGAKLYLMGNTPVVVGVGFPLNAERRSDIQHFFISLGARF